MLFYKNTAKPNTKKAFTKKNAFENNFDFCIGLFIPHF